MIRTTPDRGMPGSSYRPVAELIEAHSRRDPDKIAIVDVDLDQRITFGELAAVVGSVAVQLSSLGLRKGSRVVLLADSGIGKIALWLAIWRIGAVVCPLDLSFLRTSAPAILQTIRPDMVITDGQKADLDLPRDLPARVMRFGAWNPGASADPVGHDHITLSTDFDEGSLARLPSAALTDMACLGCTSGTSGEPKIVAYDHLSYWENGLDSIGLLELQDHDRTLEYRSLGWYSAQILSLMPFLQLGLTLHLARKFSYRRLPEWIEQYRITVCVGVPTVINILLKTPVANADKCFVSLRTVTCSTAPLTLANWRRFEQMYGIPIVNLYGSSETGWICGNGGSARRLGTAGRPVPHLQLDLLSESGGRSAAGTPGQVVIRADKLAIGYLHKDGSILPIRGNPHHLGDIAVADHDGYVQVLGRSDDLIIRGGVKISPMEIEDVVLTHPDILEAAVFGMPDPVYGQQPVCTVVLQPGRSLQAAQLLAYCAMHLPREKIPAAVTFTEALPRSSRGKLLRSRLMASHESGQSAGHSQHGI
jgi:acyl-coenzyme A synthetase/AMP-(fatty) acid ligase